MLDGIVYGGMVVDGSGRPPERMDVGITGQRITCLGDLRAAEAAWKIDANRKVVAPGFIDMHSHGDFRLPFLPTADSKLQQGVTTEVVGNCGTSMAPLSESMRVEMNETFRREPGDKQASWLSFAEYLDMLRQQGISLNAAFLVGHGTIREKVMGMSAGAPSEAQMQAMQAELRQALDSGAIGLSTGLTYTPNLYASSGEIISLARAAAVSGGLYATHIRGEGNTLLEAVDEALLIGREAGIPVEISHFKAAGMRNWHKMEAAIAKVEQARQRGQDVQVDVYPYPASNTSLSSLVPAWAHVGGKAAMLARLRDPACRERIAHELADPVGANGTGWDGIQVSFSPHDPALQGLNLQQIADQGRQDPLEAMLDLLIAGDLNIDIILFEIEEGNMQACIRQPFAMIGTDGSGYARSGPLSGGQPHPRSFGTYPRILGRYVREKQLLNLPEAVRKMTGMPADRLGLRERGYVREGCYADLVVFDPLTVVETATFEQPKAFPEGIEHVLVNGQAVISDGQHTGRRPGKILARDG